MFNLKFFRKRKRVNKVSLENSKDEVLNVALIDGQNLNMESRKYKGNIDHKRFRKFLGEKYDVCEAYYFIGYYIKNNTSL